MDEHDEQDRYVAQLQDVFNSCDPNGSGYLDRHGITLLCQRLQLDEQAPFFLQQLLKDNPHSLISFSEFKDEFISLLTHTIEQSDTLQNQKLIASPEREISPKYVRGNKKYGRRSQPESQENDYDPDDTSEFSDSEIVCNRSHSVEIINIHSCNDTDVMDHDGYLYNSSHSNNSKMFVKRKRRSRSDSESYLSSPKLYADHDHESSTNHVGNEGEYLQDIWKKLAVGTDGYLDLSELEKVCEYIGMEKLSQEMVSQLFAKLDTDQDGKISFEEFLHVFQNGETNCNPISSNNTFKAPQCNEKVLFGSKTLNSSQEERCDSTVSTAEAKMFSSLDPENTGFADTDAITDLWESLGFPNGFKLLKDLGFKSSKCINLHDLSNSLEEALTCEDAHLHQIAVATMNYELRYLRNYLEQLKIERNKLKSDVSEANIRATLLAQEIDDQNAKLEKTSQSKISMLDKKYKEQIQNLMEEHLIEKEQLNAQLLKLRQTMDSEIKSFREEQTSLQNKLEMFQKENLKFESENRELTEKLLENEKIIECQRKDLVSLFELRQKLEELELGETLNDYKYQSVLQELESLKLENQKLRDCNDELVLKVESLQQQLMSRPPPRVSSHKRNGSWLGEYVQSSAVKRKGDGTENIIENSSSCVPRVGKVRCKSPELCEEVYASEIGTENLEVYLNQDENDMFEEDIADEKSVAISYELSGKCSTNEIDSPPLIEMKQVFQFLKNKIRAEYINECQENISQNLKNIEMKNHSLENEIKLMRLHHEKELEDYQMNLQNRYDSEVRVWKMKHAELKQLFDKLSCRENQNDKWTLTDFPSFMDIEINSTILNEIMNENLNIDALKKLLISQNMKYEELQKKMEETIEELQRTHDKEKKTIKSCSNIQQKFIDQDQNQSFEISSADSCNTVSVELAGGDTFGSEELDVHSQHLLPMHSESISTELTEKLSNSESQQLSILLCDLNNLRQAYDSMQETLKTTEENYERTKNMLHKHQLEASEESNAAKQKILDLELHCCELEDRIKLLKKMNESSECEIASERIKCDQLKEMEDKLAAMEERHMQQVEELELFWRTEMDTLTNNQKLELIQARTKCVHLETRFNEMVESSVPAIVTEVSRSTVATNTDENEWRTINSELNDVLAHMSSGASEKDSENGDALINKTHLEQECEELMKRKLELEEEISILELEWATLDGVIPSKTSAAENCLIGESSNINLPLSLHSSQSLSDMNIDCDSPMKSLNKCKQTNCSENISSHLSSLGSNSEDRVRDLDHQVSCLEKKCTYLLNQNRKTEKLFKATKEQHKSEVENLKQMLRNAQEMLKQQSEEFDHQVEKADTLVKKLYLENAQLMKALQVTEERQKKAEQINVNLHDKYTALTQLVADIYQTAIA